MLQLLLTEVSPSQAAISVIFSLLLIFAVFG